MTKSMVESFPVFSLDRGDIISCGYDGNSLSNEQMQDIASKMVEEMLEGEGIHKSCIESGSNIYDAALERVLEKLSIPLLPEKRIVVKLIKSVDVTESDIRSFWSGDPEVLAVHLDTFKRLLNPFDGMEIKDAPENFQHFLQAIGELKTGDDTVEFEIPND